MKKILYYIVLVLIFVICLLLAYLLPAMLIWGKTPSGIWPYVLLMLVFYCFRFFKSLVPKFYLKEGTEDVDEKLLDDDGESDNEIGNEDDVKNKTDIVEVNTQDSIVEFQAEALDKTNTFKESTVEVLRGINEVTKFNLEEKPTTKKRNLLKVSVLILLLLNVIAVITIVVLFFNQEGGTSQEQNGKKLSPFIETQINYENARKLYDALQEDYDLGTFEQFITDIRDATKRKKLYDAIIDEYELGDFPSFEKQLGFATECSLNAIIFEYNGKKYRVKEEYLDDFVKEYPEAFTIIEKGNRKYRVKAVDYKTFLSEQLEVLYYVPLNDDEAIKLYNSLLNKGYKITDLGDKETFLNKMSNKENRQELYNWVLSRGDFRIGNYDDYEKRLTSKKTSDELSRKYTDSKKLDTPFFRQHNEKERWDSVSFVYSNFDLGFALSLPNRYSWRKTMGTAKHTVAKFVELDSDLTVFVNVQSAKEKLGSKIDILDLWEGYNDYVKLFKDYVIPITEEASGERISDFTHKKVMLCGKKAIKMKYNSMRNDDRYYDNLTAVLDYIFIYNSKIYILSIKCPKKALVAFNADGYSLEDIAKSFQIIPIHKESCDNSRSVYIKWLYEKFVLYGYDVGENIEEFDSLLKNNLESRRWAFEKAREEGLYVGKDYYEFSSIIAP